MTALAKIQPIFAISTNILLTVILKFDIVWILFTILTYMPPLTLNAVLQKQLAWALFVLLFSILVCCQPTELILGFFFLINCPIFSLTLKVHLPKVVLTDDMAAVSHRLACLTPGFSGADIRNLVNEAAIIAGRRNAESVDIDDFEVGRGVSE